LSEKPQRADWFRQPEKGGGALFELHIHDLDFVYLLCGKPRSVSAAGTRGDFGDWDSVSSLWKWKDKHALIQGDWHHPRSYPFQFGIRIRGSNGSLEYRFRVQGNVEATETAEEELVAVHEGSVESIDCSELRDGYVEEIRYLLDCVEHYKPIGEGNIVQATAVLSLLEDEKISLETGETINIK